MKINNKLSLQYFTEWLLTRKFSRSFDDKLYIKMMYYAKLGKRLNIEHPHTFNEKIQWLKLYDHNPLYSIIVDKYRVKEYVSDVIGKEYVIPTIGVWNSFSDIDFNELPNQCVLKCNHDSGGIVVCADKDKFDIESANKKISHACYATIIGKEENGRTKILNHWLWQKSILLTNQEKN